MRRFSAQPSVREREPTDCQVRCRPPGQGDGGFESLGIDYVCAGDRSLDDAAHAEGIAPEVVIASQRRLKAVEQAESWSDSPARASRRSLRR